MKRIKLFAGLALALSGLFASQTFAAGCVTSACDPGAAAAACDPVAAAPSCDPAAASPACDPVVSCNANCTPICNTGCLSASPCSPCGIGAGCNSCGSPFCGGLCRPRGCAESVLGSIKWTGYVNAGYNTNFRGDRSNGYIDAWSSSTPAFNAAYISGVKKAYTGGCGVDWGFGFDNMFGEDARILRSARGWDEDWITGHMYNPFTRAYDRGSYGFSIPQLYFEMAVNNWSVKMGHFYSLLGYEGATANKRFFYTKGLMCQLTPVTQTGVIASFNGFENLDISLGWVNGWGNGFDNSVYGEGMITGAFTYRMNEFASIKYAFMAGTADMGGIFGIPVMPSFKGTGSVHNVVLDLKLTSRLESVSLLYYGDFSGLSALILGQHFYYDINCCAKAGFRAEWLKNSAFGADTELTTIGIGLNLHPAGIQNLYIRPELRYDRATGALADQALNGRPDQFTIGFDVMLTF